MTSHVHLVFRSIKGQKPELLIGDLKKFISKANVKAIQGNPTESRKELLLEIFKKEALKGSNVSNYQFCRHEKNPIELWSTPIIKQKIDYVHQNPVEAGLTYKAEDYVYGSARDYADKTGLLSDIVVFRSYG